MTHPSFPPTAPDPMSAPRPTPTELLARLVAADEVALRAQRALFAANRAFILAEYGTVTYRAALDDMVRLDAEEDDATEAFRAVFAEIAARQDEFTEEQHARLAELNDEEAFQRRVHGSDREGMTPTPPIGPDPAAPDERRGDGGPAPARDADEA